MNQTMNKTTNYNFYKNESLILFYCIIIILLFYFCCLIFKKTYKEYFRSRYSSSKRDTMIKMYKNNLDPDNKLNNNIMYSEDGNDDPDSTNGYDPD